MEQTGKPNSVAPPRRQGDSHLSMRPTYPVLYILIAQKYKVLADRLFFDAETVYLMHQRAGLFGLAPGGV